MTRIKSLELAPNGIYYLRSQRNCINRRISLKTSNLAKAQLSAAIMRAALSCMKIDTKKIKDWSLEIAGETVKITTEDNAENRASALEAVKIIAARNVRDNENC